MNTFLKRWHSPWNPNDEAWLHWDLGTDPLGTEYDRQGQKYTGAEASMFEGQKGLKVVSEGQRKRVSRQGTQRSISSGKEFGCYSSCTGK